MGREYDNTNRAKKSARTAVRILESAEHLIRRKPLSEVTLSDIADHAEVSVQTVLRHHGSRDGVLMAMGEMLRERISSQRKAVQPGNVEAAVDNVFEHYEREGDLILRVLSEEATSSFAAEAASRGRVFHRAWVEEIFAPVLQAPDESTYDALVVATDLYTWRLLRRDLGRSKEEVRAVMLGLVQTTIGASR